MGDNDGGGDGGNAKRTVNLFHKLQRHNRANSEPTYVHPSVERVNREQRRVQFAMLKYMIFASNVIYWVIIMHQSNVSFKHEQV